MIKNIILVGLGGGAGSILRYLVQRFINTVAFPSGTLLVNIAGCLLIGLLWGLVTKNMLGENSKLLLMTGLCGGFTTFSAFSIESLQLMNDHKWLLFIVYITASVAGGLLATFVGYKMTN